MNDHWGLYVARRSNTVLVLAVIVTIAAGCGSSVGGSPPATDARTVRPSATSSAGPVPSASAVTTRSAVADGEEWIVYQWDAGGDALFLVRPDGTGQHQVVPTMAGPERHPDWSPDGSKIAFIHNTPEDRSELWVVDADGTNAKRIATCDLPCNEWNYPEWSADGRSIYVDTSADAANGPPSTFGIDRFDVASGARTTVLERKDGMTAEQHRISPDGTLMAYTRGDIHDLDLGVAIYVATVKDGVDHRLTDPMLYGAHPDWTPDGRIVFNTRDLGAFQATSESADLYVMDADGGHLTQLTHRPSHDRLTQPRVTPDGSHVIYTHVAGEGFGTRTLWVIGTDGSGDRSLSEPPIIGTHPQWRPVA